MNRCLVSLVARDLGISSLCVFAFWACGSDHSVSPPPPVPPAYLTVVRGNGQTAEASNRLPDSLVVRLATAEGIAVAGRPIHWTVTTNPGGELSNTVTFTNSKGETFVHWVLGTQEGVEGARAVYEPTASSVDFTATAYPHPQSYPPPVPRTVILRYDGSKWTSSLTSTVWTFNTIWGPKDGTPPYAGAKPCAIYRYDAQWLAQGGPCGGFDISIQSVWGSSSTDAFAIVKRGNRAPLPDYIKHYNGNTWDVVYANPSFPAESIHLQAIGGRSASDVIAVGLSGVILRGDGQTWSTQMSGTTRELLGIWGDPNSKAVYVVGAGGTTLYHDGASWNIQPSGTTESLNGVWGNSASDVFAVGDNGTILHFNGSTWTPQPSGTTKNLRGVWGFSPTSVFAVGSGSTILHYDGTSWTSQPVDVQINLNAIWGSSPTEVFAVGAPIDTP